MVLIFARPSCALASVTLANTATPASAPANSFMSLSAITWSSNASRSVARDRALNGRPSGLRAAHIEGVRAQHIESGGESGDPPQAARSIPPEHHAGEPAGEHRHHGGSEPVEQAVVAGG